MFLGKVSKASRSNTLNFRQIRKLSHNPIAIIKGWLNTWIVSGLQGYLVIVSKFPIRCYGLPQIKMTLQLQQSLAGGERHRPSLILHLILLYFILFIRAFITFSQKRLTYYHAFKEYRYHMLYKVTSPPSFRQILAVNISNIKWVRGNGYVERLILT